MNTDEKLFDSKFSIFCTCLAWLSVLIAVGLSVGPAISAEEPAYFRFIAQTEPLSPAEQIKKFHLPPGFEIELVAAEPDIRKPINLSFDAKGRLLVTGSVEYPYPAKEGRKARDAITVLEDSNDDGIFDRIETFQDGLNIPIGVTPIPGGVMAYSIPNIYRFDVDDNDGRADRSQIAYHGFDFQDTHGMPSSFTWWLDGWIYACHGEVNSSTVMGTDGQPIILHAGNTFRMKPDGSHIEHFTHGQANPFGLCFDPLGNMYSADSHSRPATLLLRGAWYPSPGTTHDGLGFGPQMMRHFHGSTGIAGIAYYAADHFPAEFYDTLFIGNPVTGKIDHDRLEVHGSTYLAIQQPDFLTCDDPWFRPVDVQLGPDGALYIADFYNRVIGHYLVPLASVQRDQERGRIWRIVYRGEGSGSKPIRSAGDLTKATADQLIDSLRDPNLLIRTHATHQLAERIAGAAENIKELFAGESHPWQRAGGLWVLHRLGELDQSSILRLANDSDRTVRTHLIKALAERADWGNDSSIVHRLVIAKLTDPDAFVRRAAADALARHPSEANIQPLLDLWADTPTEDMLLIHVLRMALRDNLQKLGNILEIAKRSSESPEDLRRLADVSLGIRKPRSAKFMFDLLQSGSVEPSRLGEYLHHAASYLDIDSLPDFFGFALTFQEKEGVVQRKVLRSVYRASKERQVQLPKRISKWGHEVSRKLLSSDNEFSIQAGIGLVWDLKLTELGGELEKLTAKSLDKKTLRSYAIDALGAVDKMRATRVLDEILGDPTEPIDLRQKAAEVLGKIDNDRSRAVSNRHLTFAPARLAITIARQLALSREGAELLFEAVGQGKASARLLGDVVVDQRLRGSKPRKLEDRLAKLLEGLPSEDDRLRRIVDQRQSGYSKAKVDPARGAKVFEKNCGICHQIGGTGKKVGPPLDGIGRRGLERILEDILDPNRNIAENFRSSVIALTDGRLVTGLVLREEGNSIVMADAQGRDLRISKNEISSRRLSNLSSMPADTAEKIPEADFHHLVSFLLEQFLVTNYSN